MDGDSDSEIDLEKYAKWREQNKADEDGEGQDLNSDESVEESKPVKSGKKAQKKAAEKAKKVVDSESGDYDDSDDQE